MIAFVLLVNSCGLFKQTSKTKQSEATAVTTAIAVDLEKDQQMEVKRETDLQSYTRLDGETVTQLEGENIIVSKDGVIRMTKGKAKQQSWENSTTIQLVSETVASKQHEKNQASLATKQALKLEKKASVHTEKPASGFFRWFWAVLFIMLFLFFRWIKKWIR